MRWRLSWKADPRVRAIADRHYNRQKPGAVQFMPPGRGLVLVDELATAAWITSWPLAEYVKHAWAGAWVCSMFRNEGAERSSDLIRDAVAATIAHFGTVPELGFVTFVDASKVKKKRDPGRCYLRAGWHYEPCALCEGSGRIIEATLEGPDVKPCPDCDGDGRARTKEERLFVLRLLPQGMPAPVAALETQQSLFFGGLS